MALALVRTTSKIGRVAGTCSGSSRCAAGPNSRRRDRRGSAALRPLRALDASVCLSVAQEEIAFALAIAAETYLSAKKKKEETGEDTNLFHPTAVVGVIVASSGLIYSRCALTLHCCFAAVPLPSNSMVRRSLTLYGHLPHRLL